MTGNDRKRKLRKKRKRIFVTEVIVLALLSVVLIFAVWATHKFSLINHEDVDVITASEANAGADDSSTQTASVSESSSTSEETQSDLTGVDIFALVGLDTRPTESDVQNSDTMMICVLNHNAKTIKLCSIYRDCYLNVIKDYYGNDNYYTKANAAYNYGGAGQFLSMLNLNLDLNITEYMTVDFTALAKVVDLLGGLDITMTRFEALTLNNYNVETSEVCGVDYEELELPDSSEFDGAMTRSFHCNGSQAVSYCRIRYTTGNDFRRASRQRVVLQLIKEKAASAGISTLDSILNAVLPMVTTNIDNMKLLTLATSAISYEMDSDDQAGFPFVHAEDDGSLTGEDAVIPVTLSYNVQQLHQFLFPDEEYTPSSTVLEYSQHISEETGYTDDDVSWLSEVDDGAEIPQWSQELQDEMMAESSSDDSTENTDEQQEAS